MPKYGAHAYLWITDWSVETGNQAINAAARVGLDFIELPLYHPEAFNAKAHKSVLKDAGLGCSGTVVLPPQAHMPENPKAAKSFLIEALNKLEAVGGFCLCGATAYELEKFTGKPPTKDERQVVIETMGEVAQEAEKRGIMLTLEVLNRYETYLYNTLADTRETILATGSKNFKIHADSYHMNIEENNFYEPLVQCADELGYMHISESHRGIPGTGNVNWEEVFRGLADAHYKGPLVYEGFINVSPDIMAATKMWRPLKVDPDFMATKALAFMRAFAQKYAL
jgi:D-psicose/D-tagatose/L-ribulose 3-epimerase